MAVNRGLYVPIDGTVGTTEVEARLALGSMFESNGNTPRSGLLLPSTPNIVTGTATTGTMTYAIAPCSPVVARSTDEGVYQFTITGNTTVTTTAAPVSGSRIDLIWVRQNDKSKGDPNNLAVVGVTQGAASSTPVAPALPAGALALAQATITSATVATNTASIVQTWRYTALRGDPIPVRSKGERAEITTPRLGQRVIRLDVNLGVTQQAVEWWNGTGWKQSYSYSEFSNTWTVSGGLASWDAGPLSEVAINTINGQCVDPSGVSGGIDILENGVYTFTAQATPLASPGRAAMLLKGAGGVTLGSSSTDGIVWETTAGFTRYLTAGTTVRVVLFQQVQTQTTTVVTVLKETGTWGI